MCHAETWFELHRPAKTVDRFLRLTLPQQNSSVLMLCEGQIRSLLEHFVQELGRPFQLSGFDEQ